MGWFFSIPVAAVFTMALPTAGSSALLSEKKTMNFGGAQSARAGDMPYPPKTRQLKKTAAVFLMRDKRAPAAQVHVVPSLL